MNWYCRIRWAGVGTAAIAGSPQQARIGRPRWQSYGRPESAAWAGYSACPCRTYGRPRKAATQSTEPHLLKCSGTGQGRKLFGFPRGQPLKLTLSLLPVCRIPGAIQFAGRNWIVWSTVDVRDGGVAAGAWSYRVHHRPDTGVRRQCGQRCKSRGSIAIEQ